jgi:hypothetical protein
MKPHVTLAAATVAVSALSILIERRFARSGVTPPTSRGLNRFHGQKTGLAAMLLRLQPFQAAQESFNAGGVPFAAPCRWYLSRVQLARDEAESIEALCPEFTNCRGQRLGFRISVPLACLPIVDSAACAGRKKAQAPQHPHYGRVVPSTTAGGRYSSSVQLIRQRPARYEPSRPKLPNSWDQSIGAGVRGPLIG